MNTAAPTTPPAAPASGSTTPGKASTAATAVIASSPGAAKPAPEMSLTPGLEQLSADEIMAAFMGSPGGSPSKEQKEGAKTNTKPKDGEGTEEGEGVSTDGDDTETGGEGTEGEGVETDSGESESEGTEGETEGDEPADGLDVLKDKPKLHKRVKQLMADNPRLKREVETLTKKVEAMSQQPDVVQAPDAYNPLAQARTDAEVDKLAGEVTASAKAKLRWLNKHSDGGTWQEGTNNALEMSAQEVENAIEHYEDLTGKIDTAKSDRKAWLKTYGETAKALGADKIKALMKPAVATRESEMFTKVPELMRDPEFLQLLADAQAGRETREKTAKGIKFVEVKAGKAKPEGEQKPGTGGSRAAAADNARARPQQKQPDKTPLTKPALDKLREDAAAGVKSAQEELMKQFLGG